MNEVSIHGSYILGNKQILDIGRHRKRQRNLDPREAKKKALQKTREAKLTHGN